MTGALTSRSESVGRTARGAAARQRRSEGNVMTDPTDRVTATTATAATTADPHLTGPRMRASDADRHATVHVLQDGMTRGLLTPGEGSDRMSAAFAAVHLEDLEPITADLPEGPAHSSRTVGWRPLLLMVLEQLQSSVRRAISGRRRPVQLGAALLLAFLLITCGLTFAHLVLDNGGGPGHGGGPGQRGSGRP